MSLAQAPVDDEQQFREEVRQGFDSDLAEISEETDQKDTLTCIQSFSFKFIKDAYHRSPSESAAVRSGLDLLWYMFIQTAMALGEDSPYQENLLHLLLWTREFDTLHKSVHGQEVDATPWESYGFAHALRATWERLLPTGTVVQQRNLASFSSKTLSTGTMRESISSTALWCLHEALETEDEAKCIRLLPMAVSWIENSRHTLLASCLSKHVCDESPEFRPAVPLTLAQNDGNAFTGFSVERWLFWRKRLQLLAQHSDIEVAKLAKRGFMAMINSGNDLDYDVPGEAKFTERLQAAMGRALVESGKESVDGDEIDIDVNWVD